MTIIRRALPQDRFVMIANGMLQDESLSFRARGILASILSRPAGWRTNSESLADQGKEGRDAIRTALSELEVAGYLRRTTERKPDGTFTAVSEVSDVPMQNLEQAREGDPDEAPEPGPGNPSPVESPGPGNPTPDNQATTTKTDDKDIQSPSVSPPREAAPDSEQGTAAAQPEAAASPSGPDLLPETYVHRHYLPEKAYIDVIVERTEGALTKAELRAETNAFIKYMEDHGRKPHGKGWHDWVLRHWERRVEDALKALGTVIEMPEQSCVRQPPSQEEREAEANAAREEAERLERGEDDDASR